MFLLAGISSEMEEVITVVSEEIKSFLDFVEESRKLHAYALEQIKLEEKRPSCKERSKLSTRLHKCRKDRRRFKDMAEEREEVVKFFQDPQHKKTLDHMTQLLGKVRKVEQYHEKRIYIPRVKE